MKTVLIAFISIASLPFVFINVSYVTFFALLTTLLYTLGAGAPLVWALGIIVVRNVRRAR